MILRWKIAQYFEAWWWRRYLRHKPVDEYISWKKQYWNSFLKSNEIEVEKGTIVLDAGCGPAGIFLAFPKNKVHAIDPLLGKYRSQLPHFQEDRFENVKFEESTIEGFSSPNKFDCIFCLNAINHVADLKKSLSNLSDSLKKGGRIYLSVDAHNYSILKKIFQLIPGDILHPHQLDLNDYLNEIEQAGLKSDKIKLIKHEAIFDYYLIEATK